MKCEFVIPKDAILTCFSKISESNINKNIGNVIAYSAFLKNDITVDMKTLATFLDLMGINRIKIIYVNNHDCVNKEFYNNIINFEKEYELISPINNPYTFISANLEGYLNSVIKGRINVIKGEYDIKHCLFIFNGYTWSNIVCEFKYYLNVEISGGSTTKRHLLSHLVLRLNSYLFGLTNCRYDILADSILFDNINKEKILPRVSFNKKNIVHNNGENIIKYIKDMDTRVGDSNKPNFKEVDV